MFDRSTVFWSYRQVELVTNVDDVGEDTTAPLVWRNGSLPSPDLVGDHSEGTDADFLGESPPTLASLTGDISASPRPHCTDHTCLVLSGGIFDPTIPSVGTLILSGGSIVPDPTSGVVNFVGGIVPFLSGSGVVNFVGGIVPFLPGSGVVNFVGGMAPSPTGSGVVNFVGGIVPFLSGSGVVNFVGGIVPFLSGSGVVNFVGAGFTTPIPDPPSTASDVEFGGDGTQPPFREIIPDGGVEFGGDGTQPFSTSHRPEGGVEFGGDGTQPFSTSHRPEGGVEFGATAPTATFRVIVAACDNPINDVLFARFLAAFCPFTPGPVVPMRYDPASGFWKGALPVPMPGGSMHLWMSGDTTLYGRAFLRLFCPGFDGPEDTIPVIESCEMIVWEFQGAFALVLGCGCDPSQNFLIRITAT